MNYRKLIMVRPDIFIRSYLLPIVSVAVFLSLTVTVEARVVNGFDLSTVTIDKDEIFHGGPKRDGIPSIDDPKFIPASEVNYLGDDDIVIGLVRGEVARAYPTRILVWHEIVNDVIEGDAVAITYCPLCGTGMVFDRSIDGETRTFGVSGLLYRSDVLMYDRETESLWSQLAMKAVSGVSVDSELTWLSSEHLTWKAWREKYPNGEVLSLDTGHDRNYMEQAYSFYFASDKSMFPVPQTRKDLPQKEWVIGVLVNEEAKAYPIKDLPSNKDIKDTIGGRDVVVRYDAEKRYPQIVDSHGEEIPSVMVFWFAWQAFYPQTRLWKV